MIGFVVMFSTTAYLTRGLQSLFAESKKGITERAEELGCDDDNIPLSNVPRTTSEASTALSLDGMLTELHPDGDGGGSVISAPSPSQNPSSIRGTVGPPTGQRGSLSYIGRTLRQDPLPLTREERWSALLAANLDIMIYTAIFVFIGIPVYGIVDYAMPIQLSLNVLAYFAALALPIKYKRFLHPVLGSSATAILGIWILALCRRESLHLGLNSYSTKSSYIPLLNGTKDLPRPGAGDFLGSVLDVSIVALALPMFQYRSELKRHVGIASHSFRLLTFSPSD